MSAGKKREGFFSSARPFCFGLKKIFLWMGNLHLGRLIHFNAITLFIMTFLTISSVAFACFFQIEYSFAGQVGELICGSEKDQQSPAAAFADANSYLIVWQDLRSGISFDIYGAGVYEGMKFGPVPICTAAMNQTNPAVAWDGLHYVVVWEDYRNGAFCDIYGVRVAKSGALLDGTASSSGRYISTAGGNQTNPDLVWNNKDCFLVVWEDHRNSDADIYGMRVSPDLTLFDGTAADGGIDLCRRAGEQKKPSVAWNGVNFFVVWEDHVSAETTDIRGLRVSPAGNILDDVWTGGIVISQDNDIQRNPDAASNGEGFFVTWDTHTTSQGYPDIYGISVTKDGIVSQNGPISISTAMHNQANPCIFWTGNNYICFWKDDRTGMVDIYWTRLDKTGRLLNSDPNSGGIALGLTNDSCIYTPPGAAFIGGKGIVIWEENYTGQLDIYGMKLTPPVPPSLEWAKGPGYESDGVEPDKGFGGETFDFRIIYKDSDKSPPTIAQVWIDLNGDNAFTFPADRKVDMTLANEETSPDYYLGAIYQANVILNYLTPSGISYRFYFKDDIDEATGEPVNISKVFVENNPPVLSWCAKDGYYNDGVDPDQAEGSFTFQFMINYRDIEGDLPEVAEVWIDWDDSGTYEQRERYVMQEADQNSIVAGRNYKKGVKILYAGDGLINYRFLFTDGYHLAVGDPNQGDPTNSHTLTVQPHLLAPILSWPDDEDFNDGIKQGTGAEENLLIFKVGYRDPDNDAPVTSEVWVDMNGDGIFTEDERFKMSPDGSQDVDFTKVNYYIKQMNISYSGDGEMQYKFVFDDGWNIATGVPFLEGGSIMVQSPISLVWSQRDGFITDGVSPDEGHKGTSFEFRVVYVNRYGYPPVSKKVCLDMDMDGQIAQDEMYDMEDADPSDIDYTDGKEYKKTIKYEGTSTGFMEYRFMFSDIYMSATGLPAQEGLTVKILTEGDPQNPGGGDVDQIASQMIEAGGAGCFVKSIWRDIPLPAQAGVREDDTLTGPAAPPVKTWMIIFKFGLVLLLCMILICFVMFGYSTAKGKQPNL
ncbi:hypothetical protein JXL19_01475 [bacterium]|nr:hypothetical protein [bacterium]